MGGDEDCNSRFHNCKNTTSCVCRILSNEIWRIRQDSTISLIARNDSMPYDKYDGEKRGNLKKTVRKKGGLSMKMKMFQRLNDPCALWRAKLEKAYMAGDEETMQKMSRKIDEYQKTIWKENRKTKEISI